VSYEEQVSAIREQLAALFEAQEEWSKAARALAGIDLDSGMRLLDAGARHPLALWPSSTAFC
jgi:COP9 signalosome complex subunit 4